MILSGFPLLLGLDTLLNLLVGSKLVTLKNPSPSSLAFYDLFFLRPGDTTLMRLTTLKEVLTLFGDLRPISSPNSSFLLTNNLSRTLFS